jgi:hypothetical protein
MSDSDPEILGRPALHPVATILRGRGFVPLPRLWVRSEDIPKVHKIANKYREKVNAVRTQVERDILGNGRGFPPKPDPKDDKDTAWGAAERLTEHPWKGWNFGDVRTQEEIPAEPGDPRN